jgi:hypothetical protein
MAKSKEMASILITLINLSIKESLRRINLKERVRLHIKMELFLLGNLMDSIEEKVSLS